MKPFVPIVSFLFLMSSMTYSLAAQTNEAPNTSTKLLSELISSVRKGPSYRQKAFNAVTKSTLRNLMTSEEAYYVDNETYVSCRDSECSSIMPYFVLPEELTVSVTAKENGYTATAARKDGSGKHYSFDTDEALIQEMKPSNSD